MQGIYKITSPTKNVYIGQSTNISARFRQHKSSCKNQFLKTSFKKHGYENHEFEILHMLPIDIDQDVLNEYEILYIDFYKSANIKLFNLRDGGNHGGKMSKELIDKLTAKKIGKKMPDSTREALRKSNLGKKMPKHIDEIFAKYRTSEQAIKMGKMNIGKVRTEENKKKISDTLKNKIDNRGEFHGKSKLNNIKVLEIRQKHKSGKYSSTILAKEYSISKTNVLDVINNKIWKHI
jgi:group I intron endonuclease